MTCIRVRTGAGQNMLLYANRVDNGLAQNIGLLQAAHAYFILLGTTADKRMTPPQ